MFLRPSLCAFLDILGFSDATEQAYDAGTQTQLLTDVANAIEAARKRLKDWQKGEEPILDVKMFTDNLVIRRTYLRNLKIEAWNELQDVCFAIADFQLTMACNGFFMRGGVSIGTMAINDAIVFGDALIKAYKLEHDKARMPRVVLDPKLKALISSASEIERDTWKCLLMSDVDDFYFVNYLSAIYELHPLAPGGPAMIPNEKKLAEHREKVEQRLKETKAEPEKWSKYFWSANYHDSFCESIDMKHHKIDASLIRSNPTSLLGFSNQF
jgi:hypothetical protein